MKKYIFPILIMAIFAVGFAASDDNGSDSDTSATNNSTVESNESMDESTSYTDESDGVEDPTSDRYAWLQGHWVYEQGSYKGHLIINGNRITQYSSMSSQRDEYPFRIEDGAIKATVIDGMDMVINIDFTNHRLDYGDGQWMHKAGETSYDDTTSSTDIANARSYARLKELGRKGTELTDEIASMRRTGQMDLVRFTSLSQAILGVKQEQISIAERIGDAELIYEYQQQYSQTTEALRMMENGY